jgi:rhodanese-related sulfurtransferase
LGVTKEVRVFGRKRIENVSPAEAARLQRDGAVLVDVREPEEWDAGHAPHAVHLPLREVVSAVGRLGGRPVLTVCRSGARSSLAAMSLADAGLHARNVAGGMKSWAAGGLPVVRDDGSPGAVG